MSVEEIRLRIQDALTSIEPVFIGEAGKDYEEDKMKMKLKAAHAYSQLAGKLQKIIEIDELEQRISRLERQNKMSKVG